MVDMLLLAPPILVALTFHEYAHGYVAFKLGDPTAKMAGRLTLNPLSHLDPIGTIMLFVVHFGWAKPVPVNPSNYGNRKRDDIFVSMAGPAMNVILAVGIMAVYRLAIELPIDLGPDAVVHKLGLVAYISMILCVFNLIPIPPLDGSHVLRQVIGMSEETYMQIAQYGFIILLLAINLFPQLFQIVGSVSLGAIQLFQKILMF